MFENKVIFRTLCQDKKGLPRMTGWQPFHLTAFLFFQNLLPPL